MSTYPTPEHEVSTRVCYAAVFGDGLTLDQLIRSSRFGARQVGQAVVGLVAAGRLRERDGRYCLPGAGSTATSKRQRRALARDVVVGNRRLIRAVARVPFVQVLAISGSVATSNPRGENGRSPDLDFFVITSPHAMHVARFLVLLLLRLERFLPKQLASARFRPCFNYFLDGAAPDVVNESFYTATEACTVRVLKGRAAYRAFLDRNAWIQRYYGEGPRGVRGGGGPGQRGALRWLVRTINACTFVILWARSWAKQAIARRPQRYTLRDDPSREITLRRAWPAAGGYQVEVFKRFRALYEAHFPDLHSPGYLEFLFPGTTPSGISIAGTFVPTPPDRELGRFD